ncbi:MAG: hypothetical protein KF699_11230 [Phycisphaeraceae bacterium]|nr:hypothetical protein [Phycisphaeraceae bacterium]MBX3406506.1 hypothetical protein [Phycisphaeraceae bacterium]
MRARTSNTDRPGARGRAARRRGVTLLEIILSVVLLTGVATAILAAISYVEAGDGRDRRRLAAHEIGGRLVLQWLDDFDKMPAPLEPIPYNRDEFLYTCDIAPVVMNLNERQRRGETSLQGLDRFLLISVRVYEAVPNGTSTPSRGEELAHVWRLCDPSASRNPDAMDRFGKDPEKINWLLNVILKGVGGGRVPTNGGLR